MKRSPDHRQHQEQKRKWADSASSNSSLPSLKKAKVGQDFPTTDELDISATATSVLSQPELPKIDIGTGSLHISALADDLAGTHNVTTMRIISSTQIQQKVTQILETLSTFSFEPPAKPNLVVLHAKASVASKLISIAEIAKREIAGSGGKWFQYNQLEGTVVTREREAAPHSGNKTKHKGGDAMDVDEEGAGKSDEEETASFETMKTPIERALEGRPVIRAVPVLTLYLSRVRIDSLRKKYGEQTNALQMPA